MITGDSPIGLVLLLPLTVVAFLFPGWMISRRFGSTAPLLTAFLLSAALWFNLALGCDAAGLPLNRSVVLGLWSLLCLVSVAVARHHRVLPDRGLWQDIKPVGSEWIWFAAAAAGFASLALRAVIDPLSGWDNLFRWDYLARAILTHGHLHFYPPIQAADFEIYGWCDGIPPLVSLLNLWIYLLTGVAHPSVTALRVAGEGLLIGLAALHFGRELWGPRGGWPAAGLLGTSALALWGVAMGQETGLLALTLVAMVWLLERHRRIPAPGLVVWAGLAAGVGALSRDYGVVFPLLGLAVLALQDLRLKPLLAFSTTAAVVGAPWYLRNWVLTGNPIFPLSPGGLFPTNPAYTDVMQRIWNDRSFGSNHVNYLLLAATLAVIAGGVVAAAAVGAWRARRASVGLLAAVALTVALWAWSVPWTAGGVNYSLRVLTPAAALCAVLGAWLGTTRPGFGRAAVLAAVVVLSADAARRSWLLPIFPRAPIVPWSFDDWRTVQTDLRRLDENPLWDYLHQAADGDLVAVDNPNAYVALTRRGGRASMWFSPVFAGCFDPSPKFEDTVHRLREAHVRLVVLSVGDRVALSFIKAHPFFEMLRTGFRPLVAVQTVAVYDLDRLQPSNP